MAFDDADSYRREHHRFQHNAVVDLYEQIDTLRSKIFQWVESNSAGDLERSLRRWTSHKLRLAYSLANANRPPSDNLGLELYLPDGNSLARVSALHGRVDLIPILHDFGVNLNEAAQDTGTQRTVSNRFMSNVRGEQSSPKEKAVPDKFPSVPSHVAAVLGDVTYLSALQQAGVDLGALDGEDTPATAVLSYAPTIFDGSSKQRSHQIDTLRALFLDLDVPFDPRCITAAILAGKRVLVKDLMNIYREKQENAEAISLDACMYKGRSPFTVAADLKREDLLCQLVAEPLLVGNIDDKDSRGWTAFGRVARRGDIPMLMTLFDLQASPDIPASPKGKLPFQIAKKRGHPDFATLALPGGYQTLVDGINVILAKEPPERRGPAAAPRASV